MSRSHSSTGQASKPMEQKKLINIKINRETKQYRARKQREAKLQQATRDFASLRSQSNMTSNEQLLNNIAGKSIRSHESDTMIATQHDFDQIKPGSTNFLYEIQTLQNKSIENTHAALGAMPRVFDHLHPQRSAMNSFGQPHFKDKLIKIPKNLLQRMGNYHTKKSESITPSLHDFMEMEHQLANQNLDLYQARTN